uniref:Zinc finger protein n=1 Tax=Loa loa TaxID=7209 RepID=A0A1I7V9K6_LOALO
MVNSFKVEEVELKYTEILAQLRVDNFIQFKEPETEPLDLSMSRVCGGRIEPSDVSIPEVSEGEIEPSEINQENTRLLNIPIQEAGRKQISIGDMPKKFWSKRYQNETSNIQTFKRKHPENTTHTSAKQFKCEKEDFVALPNTYVMNHTDKKSYCCPKCGRNFTPLSVLNEHMKIHTGKKSHSCPECGKNFTQSSRLNEHKKIHTGVKLHSCPICGMNFAQTAGLYHHKQIHDGKLHSCLKCGKNFTQTTGLYQHKKTHTDELHSCPGCGKNFTRSSSLNRHKKTHTDEKLHSCPECGKNFTRSSSLNRHMKTHTVRNRTLVSNVGRICPSQRVCITTRKFMPESSTLV